MLRILYAKKLIREIFLLKENIKMTMRTLQENLQKV